MRAVERLRYQSYVERLGADRPTADHRGKLLPLPADHQSRVLYAVEDGQVVGTLRIRHAMLGPYTESEIQVFAPQAFSAVAPIERTTIIDAFAIREDRQASAVRIDLFAEVARYWASEEVKLAFCDCMPHLLGNYQRLGFRPYKPNASFPEAGLVIPLVLVIDDLDHLESVGSPVLSLLRAAGGCWDRARGREIAAYILASGQDHVVEDTADDLDEHAPAIIDRPDHRLSVFGGMTAEERRKIMEKSSVIEACEGDALIREGHGTSNLFVILQGAAHVVLPDGRVIELGGGELFGEAAFFLGRRTADVIVASETARILALSRSTLNQLLDTHPRTAARLAMNLGRLLASRLNTPAAPGPGVGVKETDGFR
ncbi:cyclic nucleotide-binding domain-containing protein [Kitasatospora sp. NPDC048540]|uniref:cyclic nucleotide-binding domain-containing protein n=1 Tax=unclassified Kitasatospora TaxID=2633591 RepID=UPI00053AA91E|nr:cyclic nucleotide-binding domain-containing protein [Kitasatospora sp. MBT63]